jgi:uncharacterized protein YpmS
MKDIVKQIISIIIGTVILNIFNKVTGGNVIQVVAIYLWKHFPFEIVTLFLAFFVFIFMRLFSIHNEYQSLKKWIGHERTAFNPKKDKEQYNLNALIENKVSEAIDDLIKRKKL